MVERGLNHEEHAEDIGLERPAELFLADIANILIGMLFARIVHQYVEPPQFLHRFVDSRLAEAPAAKVAGDRDGPAPFAFYDTAGFACVGMFAQVKYGDVRAFARKQGSDGAADAAIAAGDDGDLVLQTPRSRIARMPVRFRFQLAFFTGQIVFMN